MSEPGSRFSFTGYQLKCVLDFIDGEDDCEVTIAYFDACPDTENTGETMPAGDYVWLTEYPEEGRMWLPVERTADAGSAEHEHTWIFGEVDEPEYCKRCGVVRNADAGSGEGK